MTRTARLEALNTYLGQDIETVNGWCAPQIWQAIWPLSKQIGDGPVAEIGVYAGKFLMGMCKTFGTSEQNMATAIDVFGLQEFNIDKSGLVDKLDEFRTNLDAHGIGAGNVHCLARDSLSLNAMDAKEMLERTGPCSFFSVDGCHEVVHTVNDIEFAMSVTAPNGVIAIDDYHNPDWPGVQEAVARMYLLRNFAFVPVVVTRSKMFLCGYSYQQRYLEAVHSYVRAHHPGTRMKRVKRFGFDTLTLQPELEPWTDLCDIT